MTPAELDQLSLLADQVEQAGGRMSRMIERAVAAVDAPLDEAAMRQEVAARLAYEPVLVDPARLDFAA